MKLKKKGNICIENIFFYIFNYINSKIFLGCQKQVSKIHLKCN